MAVVAGFWPACAACQLGCGGCGKMRLFAKASRILRSTVLMELVWENSQNPKMRASHSHLAMLQGSSLIYVLRGAFSRRQTVAIGFANKKCQY